MREQQTRTMAGLLYSIGSAIIGLIAVLMAFEVLGFDIAPAMATAGVASIAIAFGAQSLLKDFINGFFIVFEDQYVVGDLIQVNGETGRVEHLTLRRTVLRNPAGAMVTVPKTKAKATRAEIALRSIGLFIGYPLSSNLSVHALNLVISG